MGLHGENEIIGVGDSGLDTGHCFFEEAQGGEAGTQKYGPDHRKVVAYRDYADKGATGQRDHGTHVVGSILGQSSTDGAAGAGERGSAYAAKVSFTDIGPGDAPGLQVPNDLAGNFFNVDYDNGARIHSNSWGANVNAYTTSTVGTDQAMYEMDDLVILFAAGNSGNPARTPSIGAPATCKNCITVGATENDESQTQQGVSTALAPHPPYPRPHPRPRPRPPPCPSSPHPRPRPRPRLQDGELADFSSTGLAVGGRIKPDVTAPGFFISSANSNADGDCPITEMAGTSMATPITAGNVALIRQYLREGFYPTGKRGNNLGGNNFDCGMIPSGALMKAMTISAGQVMPGRFPQPDRDQGPTLDGYPNQYSGYGRTQLNTVLYAEDNGKTAGDRLFIIDGETVATGEEKVYTIPTRADDEEWGTEFKVVLVWTDPPAEPISNNPLVNNLDLEVDGLNGNSDGNTGAARDTVNNVEAVKLTATAGGTIEVKVKGTSVVEGGPQKFALVVTGPLQLTSPPPAPRPSPPGPQPPPTPQPPGATNEIVSAKEVTLVLNAVGTVEDYRAKADSVKASLRQELRCFLPACMLTVTVEAGSVITVVATDTEGAASSQVESAALALHAKPLDAMSSALGITIEEVPNPPSAVAVQVEVTRLAPSPPPQVTQLAPSPPSTSPDHCSVQDCERDLAESQADYQQAVAAGETDMHDAFCAIAGLLLANPTECDTSADDSLTLCNNIDLADCNCGIDNAASFEGVSDCPDLHARMGRVCEKLRTCDDPDSGPGLAIGLALGGCLLVAMLAAAVFVWHRKRRTQPPQSSASNAAPQQVEVMVTQPESKKAAAPESLAALLAACGLEHHEETFIAEEYTLDTLLSSMARGEEALKDDLRELKLTLGECRKLINHLGANK